MDRHRHKITKTASETQNGKYECTCIKISLNRSTKSTPQEPTEAHTFVGQGEQLRQRILIDGSNNELLPTIKQDVWIQTLRKTRLLNTRIITKKPLIRRHIKDKTSVMTIREGTRVVYN